MLIGLLLARSGDQRPGRIAILLPMVRLTFTLLSPLDPGGGSGLHPDVGHADGRGPPDPCRVILLHVRQNASASSAASRLGHSQRRVALIIYLWVGVWVFRRRQHDIPGRDTSPRHSWWG